MIQKTEVVETTEYQNKENQNRAAVRFARFVGSWRFIIGQSFFMAAYIVWNSVSGTPHFDPYPFILLNLVLSFQAAYTGPVILMAQNVQDQQDREIVYKDFELSISADRELRQILELTKQNDSDIEKILEHIKKFNNDKKGK